MCFWHVPGHPRKYKDQRVIHYHMCCDLISLNLQPINGEVSFNSVVCTMIKCDDRNNDTVHLNTEEFRTMLKSKLR